MRWVWLAAFLYLFYPTLAFSTPTCGQADKVKINMALQGNKAWFRGLSVRGHMVEVWVNAKTDEFVAFVVYPNKKLCVVDMGAFAETRILLEKSKGDLK